MCLVEYLHVLLHFYWLHNIVTYTHDRKQA
jgi:hypothetical protein